MAFPLISVKSEPETWELNKDGIDGTSSDCEEVSFSDVTLRQLKRKCKAKRKLSKFKNFKEDVETCSSSDGPTSDKGYTNKRPNEVPDLDESISSIKSKLSKKSKSKRRCTRKCVSPSSESTVSQEDSVEQESLLHEPVRVKIATSEPDLCFSASATCLSSSDVDFSGGMCHEVAIRPSGGELRAGERASLHCTVNEVSHEHLELDDLEIGKSSQSTYVTESSQICLVSEAPFESLEITKLGNGESVCLTEESSHCDIDMVQCEPLQIIEFGAHESISTTGEESSSCILDKLHLESLGIDASYSEELNSLTEKLSTHVFTEAPFQCMELGGSLPFSVSDVKIVEAIKEFISSPFVETKEERNIVLPVSVSFPSQAIPAIVNSYSEVDRSCNDVSSSQAISCLIDNCTPYKIPEMSTGDSLGSVEQSKDNEGCDSETRGECDSNVDTIPSFEDKFVNNSVGPYFSLQTGSDSVDHCSPTAIVDMYSSFATAETFSAVVGAPEGSPEISHDATGDELKIMDGLDTCHGPSLEYPPKRLFSTRKAISPSSQEKLLHAVESDDLYDNIEPSRLSLQGSKSTINPSRVLKKRKSAKNGSSLLVPKSILRSKNVSSVLKCDNTESPSIQTCAQKAIAFSQRQMHDIESLAMKLMRELNCMKEIVQETLLFEPCSSAHMKNTVDKISVANERVAEAEETTKKWLSIMAKDCNRFCKIMKLNERKVASNAATVDSAPFNSQVIHKERKRIKFADEAGGTLCHIKVFQNQSSCMLDSETEMLNQEN